MLVITRKVLCKYHFGSQRSTKIGSNGDGQPWYPAMTWSWMMSTYEGNASHLFTANSAACQRWLTLGWRKNLVSEARHAMHRHVAPSIQMKEVSCLCMMRNSRIVWTREGEQFCVDFWSSEEHPNPLCSLNNEMSLGCNVSEDSAYHTSSSIYWADSGREPVISIEKNRNPQRTVITTTEYSQNCSRRQTVRFANGIEVATRLDTIFLSK